MIRLFHALGDLVFPPRCIFCGEVTAHRGCRCDKCGRTPPQADPRPRCPGCGKLQEGCVCAEHDFRFDGAAAPFPYEGEMVSAVLQAKENCNRDALDFFAGHMAGAARAAGWKATLVTWVPMHPEKERERGYNPARELAELTAARLRLPARELLRKRRQNPPQHTLSAGERWENIRDVFGRAVLTPLKNHRVILVDDILTTGATADACAAALKKMGAKKVWVLSAASTEKHCLHEPPKEIIIEERHFTDRGD